MKKASTSSSVTRYQSTDRCQTYELPSKKSFSRSSFSFHLNFRCKRKNYFVNLPSTSVVIVCYNEWPSMLLRTIHSVYNRSPRELLKEIIVVDDASTIPELKTPLDDYVLKNFDGRVKIRRLEQRAGLIVARMEGAKAATGEVIIFLDGHMEVSRVYRFFYSHEFSIKLQANVNWMPPLLEPIVMSPTTVTTPAMDSLVHQTFQYFELKVLRGVFNEIMWYQWNTPTRLDQWLPDQPRQVCNQPRSTLFTLI